MQRVGTCSICGGDVIGHRGPWLAVIPPPSDTCTSCGAVAAADVIPMFPRPVVMRQVFHVERGPGLLPGDRVKLAARPQGGPTGGARGGPTG